MLKSDLNTIISEVKVCSVPIGLSHFYGDKKSQTPSKSKTNRYQTTKISENISWLDCSKNKKSHYMILCDSRGVNCILGVLGVSRKHGNLKIK